MHDTDMPNPSSLSELTREQLHELVWSTPVAKLAEQFGVSDVAIAKRCKKLFVPRPGRGYWVKLEFGKEVDRPALPPVPRSPAEVFAEEAGKPMSATVRLPSDHEALHPRATQLLTALRDAKLGYDKHRVQLRERELPETLISKAQAQRAAAAFHALLNLVEPRGIPFKRALGSYEGGYFRKGNDRLYFKIEEELVDRPAESKRRKGYYSTWQHENKVPSGRLIFTINSARYNKDSEKLWGESDKTPLESIVVDIAKEICGRFAAFQKQRQAEAIQREKDRIESKIRWEKYQEEEAIRRQEEAKRKHADALEQIARSRQEDLLKAAEWWRHYRGVEDFLVECERRWRAFQNGMISPEQDAWLTWAREVAKGVSPFETGYPEPLRDGSFDAANVPFGGPYPEKRKFPSPPSMPEIPSPVVVQQGYGVPPQQPQTKPFPFWLMYQRR